MTKPFQAQCAQLPIGMASPAQRLLSDENAMGQAVPCMCQVASQQCSPTALKKGGAAKSSGAKSAKPHHDWHGFGGGKTGKHHHGF